MWNRHLWESFLDKLLLEISRRVYPRMTIQFHLLLWCSSIGQDRPFSSWTNSLQCMHLCNLWFDNYLLMLEILPWRSQNERRTRVCQLIRLLLPLFLLRRGSLLWLGGLSEWLLRLLLSRRLWFREISIRVIWALSIITDELPTWVFRSWETLVGVWDLHPALSLGSMWTLKILLRKSLLLFTRIHIFHAICSFVVKVLGRFESSSGVQRHLCLDL